VTSSQAVLADSVDKETGPVASCFVACSRARAHYALARSTHRKKMKKTFDPSKSSIARVLALRLITVRLPRI